MIRQQIARMLRFAEMLLKEMSMMTRKGLKGSACKQISGRIRIAKSQCIADTTSGLVLSASRAVEQNCAGSSSTLAPNNSASPYDGEHLMMSKFLDLIWRDVEENPANLIPYTEEMDAELDELLAGVEVD